MRIRVCVECPRIAVSGCVWVRVSVGVVRCPLAASASEGSAAAAPTHTQAADPAPLSLPLAYRIRPRACLSATASAPIWWLWGPPWSAGNTALFTAASKS